METQRENQALMDRQLILEEKIVETENQLAKLLDLYLDGDFPKEVLTERKVRLEDLFFNLGKEQNELMSHVKHVTVMDDQLAYIEEFCAKIRKGLEKADFKTKRQIIELLDNRGQIAFENNEKVVYLKCLITLPEQQQVLRMQISP